MADLEQQIQDYAAGLDLGPAIDPDQIEQHLDEARRIGRRPHRGAFLVAATLLVVVVIGAAVVALWSDHAPAPTPPAGPTVIPQSWDRTATVDGAQPFAMASSDRGIVLVGYGAWWSADGSAWIEGDVEGLDGPAPAFPGSVSDVVATPDGFVAVGTGGDKQPAVWRSTDGRSWARVADADLTVGERLIPSSVSTPYGSIASVAVTDQGLVAVGQVFAGTFSGETLTSALPFAPAIWTSSDGSNWERARSLPPGPGSLGSVAATSHGTIAVGVQADHGVVWKRDGDDWEELGRTEGGSGQLAEVGGRLVVAGGRSVSGQSSEVATIWSSADGRDWSISHEEAPAVISHFDALAADGAALVVLGWSGPGELDLAGTVLLSTDGTTWGPLPTIEAPAAPCGPKLDAATGCPSVVPYPVAAVQHGEDLLVAMQEAVTDGPNAPTRLRTAIYRARPTTVAVR